MASADLVRAQYSGLDFNTHLDDLRARVQVKYAATYNDFAASALGMMLLDSVSFGLDTLSFYLDRRATDTYLSTARTRKSVARLTRQLGYKMRAAVSSSVDLSITIASPGFNVTMPKGFQFTGPDDLIYENAQSVTWLSTDTIRTKSVSCYEGVTVVESFVSDGSANQVFQLKRVPDQSFAVSGSVTVTVNGASFVESEFLSFDATDQFEVGYNDDPPTIRFGDGTAGNIPISGASIVVTYVGSRGLNGLVGSHTITAEKNALVVSFQPITMTVDNALGSIGGDDPETLSHAKTFAPLVYKSRFVAVTRPDYEALSGSFADPLFGRVAVAQAVSSRTAAADTDLNTNISIIEGAIDDPLLSAAGPFTITGTASVSTLGVVTGAATQFLSELSVGNFVKFGVDTVLREVTAISDDLQCSVSPLPLIPLPVAGMLRYGKDLARARSSLRDVNSELLRLTSVTSDTAVLGTAVDGQLVSATSAVRTQRDNSISTQLDATSASSHANVARVTVNALATTLTTLGVGTNSSVVYAPKVEGVTVAHVAAGALSVVVIGTSITVNRAAGSTALQVSEAVNGDLNAGALVRASYTGNGSGIAEITAAAITMYLPPVTKAALLTELDATISKAGLASSTAAGMGVGLDSVVTIMGAARQNVAAIGRTVAEGQMLLLNGIGNNIQLRVGPTLTLSAYDSIAPAEDMSVSLDNIDSAVVSNKTAIQAALDQIYNHVDALLSADCKANLVTVPILARDKAGF